MASERPHGTANRYRHGPDENDQPGRGCHCPPCTAASTKAMKLRRIETLSGATSRMVDAEQARRHVLELNAAGLAFTTIAELAGVRDAVVYRLIYGDVRGYPPSKRLLRSNSDALLAVRADQVGSAKYTLAVGTQRRLRGLAWQGWPSVYVGPRIPLNHEHLRNLMAGRVGPTVTVDTARRVTAVFRDLWFVDPVSAGVPPAKVSQVRTLSRRKGWVSAWAWDNIDDPASVPDVGEETPSRRFALAEDASEIMRQGYTADQAAERLGVKPRTVQEALAWARRRELVSA